MALKFHLVGDPIKSDFYRDSRSRHEDPAALVKNEGLEARLQKGHDAYFILTSRIIVA